jgi:hypothetical protein
MNAYICEWERLDAPTRLMTEDQARVPMAELPAAKGRKATQPGCCPTCGAMREAVAA